MTARHDVQEAALRSGARRAVDPAAGLEQIPLGTQPDENGQLRCLLCGRWFRQLGQHVVAKHKISADAYRERFQLPRRQGLHSAAVRAQRANHERERWRNDPDLQARFRPTQTTHEQRMSMARAARLSSAGRAGVKSRLAATGKAAHEAMIAGKDQQLDAAAVRAGFSGLTDALQRTMDLPAHEVARVLGLTDDQVYRVRSRHNVVATVRGRPPGLKAGDRQECLVCHRPFLGLGQHLRMKHQLSVAAYRNQYLPGVVPAADDAGTSVPGRRGRHRGSAPDQRPA